MKKKTEGTFSLFESSELRVRLFLLTKIFYVHTIIYTRIHVRVIYFYEFCVSVYRSMYTVLRTCIYTHLCVCVYVCSVCVYVCNILFYIDRDI